jgi:hypothetical protein
MTTARSILLGGLCLGTLLAGCPFEDPPVISEDSDTVGTEGVTTGGPTTSPTTTPTTTTVDPTSDVTTSVDPTTMGSVDDTTMGMTTSEVTATESSSSSDTNGDPCMAVCDGLACGSIDVCECGACGPMATCSDDQTYCGVPVGFYNDFGFTPAVNGQLQLGFRFQVFAPTSVRRLGVISGGAGANIRLALYDHDGAGPANRLVQTGAVMLYANGYNEYDVGATPLIPGDYWVMVHTEGNTPIRRTFNGDDGYERAVRVSIPFASGFPVVMNDEMVGLDYRYNLYMIVEE